MKKAALAILFAAASAQAGLPEPTAEKLPQWRGFNMQNLYWEGSRNVPFVESDFRIISEIGANFLRIPVTYKLITQPEDFRTIDPELLAPLEQAMAWGKQYDIHICLNLFQVPGHCITPENDPRWPPEWILWEDEVAQEIFVDYWRFLAERYRDIPNRNLSFNLINEPQWNVPEKDYAVVMRKAIHAIREIDPDRLIIVDGVKAASEPCWDLVDEGVAQALHFYKPFALTHYLADWLENPPDRLPDTWPLPLISKHLYGERHRFSQPFVIRGGFERPHRVTVKIEDVVGNQHQPLTFELKADRKTLIRETWIPESGKLLKQGGLFQQPVNVDLTAEIPRGTKVLSLEVANGDRLTLRGVVLEDMETKTKREIVPVVTDWGSVQSPMTYDPAAGFTAEAYLDRDWLFEKYLVNFQRLQEKGVGVMVQEFGCHNQTPHPLVLDWMEDCLDMFGEAGWGWALWEWEGPFGPINSKRPDVEYLEHEGRQIDLEMLNLLKRKLAE